MMWLDLVLAITFTYWVFRPEEIGRHIGKTAKAYRKAMSDG